MKRVSKKFFTAALLLLVFIAYTALVTKVDVAAIGPNGTSVGLAGLNQYFNDLVNSRQFIFPMDMWYTITKLLAAFSIACGCGFGLVGLIQLIREKSLLKVNYVILLLGCVYVTLGVLYVVFAKYPFNYRPVLEADGTLEASFPSSHTLLVVTIMLTAMRALPKLVKEKVLLTVADIIAIAAMILMVVGRLLSGVHWFTDILGGVLLSVALEALFSAFVSLVGHNVRKKKRHHHKHRKSHSEE